MRTLIIITVLLAAGCVRVPKHQQGGEASAVLPNAPASEIRLKQPENPEGASQIGYAERRETTHPDGTVEVYEREVGTDLGGSQDFAEIVSEVMKANLFRGLLMGAGLGICAVVAASRGWPILGGVLGLGALSSIVVAWWAGVLAMVAALLLFTAYQVALAQGIPLPVRPNT